jgi:hypothetical protein
MPTTQTAPKRAVRIAALSLVFLMLLAIMPATAPVQAEPPSPAAVGDSITWDANPIIVTNVERANFPWVAVDNNNKTHIVYYFRPLGSTTWEIRYTNNVNGSFNSFGQLIDPIASNPAVPSAIIMAGPGNVLHLLYILTKTDDKLYYRQSTNSGATWSARQEISGGGKSAAPNMTIDSAGNAHITWINDQCGSSIYNVFYRVRSASGSLSALSQPKSDCSTFQNRPIVTVAGGKPHVVFQNGSSSGAEIYYARLEGSQWINQNISASGSVGSQNPAFASDGGNNLFVAWDENIGGHDILFKTSSNGGQTWSTAINLTNNSGLSTYPYVGWSSTSQRAYIVWHDQNNIPGSPEEIWEREFNPATTITSDGFQVSKTASDSLNPVIALGPSRAEVVWHDNTPGKYQIYDLGGLIKGGGSGCSGTLSLAGGAEMTKTNPVPGAITANCPDSGNPNQMQISVDAQLTSTTDPAPVPYNQSPSITIPSGGCEHTVYVRLFKDNIAGSVFEDKIKVDSSVNANVYAVNPNMAGLPPIYTQRISPADAYLGGGAKDGDPRYTRVRKFFLGVNDAADCAGLKEFSALLTGEPVISLTDNEGYTGSPALPGSGTPGSRSVTVLVTDTLGTGQEFSTPLIYDPADIDPSETVTNTSGLPVLNMSQNPSVASQATTNNVLVNLLFNNIQVNDNLYGDGAGPGTNDYWGVWIANSPTDISAESPLLNWVPIAVPSPGATFSIEWSLFSGIDTPADRRAGVYFVYVRFLDGAGNPSAAVLKTQITLLSPFSTPAVYTPVIRR